MNFVRHAKNSSLNIYLQLLFHTVTEETFHPLNPKLNPICYLLALLAHHFLHVSRIMDKSLPLRLLMSYLHVSRIMVKSLPLRLLMSYLHVSRIMDKSLPLRLLMSYLHVSRIMVKSFPLGF